MILSKFQLTDRVAIVTGAGKGIGKGIALGLAEAGANVVVVARTVEHIEATAAEVRALGRRTLAIPADVRNSEQVQNVVQKTIAEFGRIDILVNNVGGGGFPSSFMDISENRWDAVLRVNLKSCVICTQAVLKTMLGQRSGAIINIASGAGLVGTPRQAAYGAAKAAVVNLTDSLASELAPFNVRVNCIASGPIATEGLVETMSEAAKTELISHLAIKRLGTPQDIAAATVFLAADASEWVTGKTLQIDGGYRCPHMLV
ncbi:MAG: glucose 1-dehydrogenase [Dehalococcoidia bacterium]|nr:glucose 1-dehydrogenase [Dehalococcoidia bacterium]